MNLFKKFHIQWAWFLDRRGPRTGMLIVAIAQLFVVVGTLVFILGFARNQEGERIIANNSIQIIGGISALVFSYLYLVYLIYADSSKNFKIAIDKAEKFVVKNPECFPKINILIAQTEQTKDPAKLNEWIDNWEKLSSTEANMQNLEKKKEEIVKGIPLKEINAKIEVEWERIKELESELA